MARNYELTFIARPEMDPAGLTALIERVKGFITAEGGTVVKADQWGVRRLSYPINKIRDGQYVFLFVQLEAQSVQKVESRLKLVESVIRYLLVKSEDTNITKAEPVAEAVEPAVKPAVEPAVEPVAEAVPTVTKPVAAVAEETTSTPVATAPDTAAAESSPTQEQAQPTPVVE